MDGHGLFGTFFITNLHSDHRQVSNKYSQAYSYNTTHKKLFISDL